MYINLCVSIHLALMHFRTQLRLRLELGLGFRLGLVLRCESALVPVHFIDCLNL